MSNISIFAFSIFAAAPFAYASSAPVPAAGARPNVIFILVDDMGWGDLNINWERYGTAFGNRPDRVAYKTPGLDKLAQDGKLLLRHYTAAPVSVAARACLLTGMHTGHTRNVRDNCFDHPIANVHTLGSVMQDAGYATAVIGKWGVGGGGESRTPLTASPLSRGFDYFYGMNAHIAGHFHYPANRVGTNNKISLQENDTVFLSKDIASPLSEVYAYSTDLFTARAKKWLLDNDPAKTKKPFFLMLNYIAPHASLRVPACSYPTGGGKNGGIQWVNYTGKSGSVGTCNTSTKELAEAAGANWFGMDAYIHPDNSGFSGKNNQRHSTMVRRISDAVVDIRQLLSDMGVDKDTMIVFTSDNGPHNESGADAGGGKADPTYFKTYGMMDGIKRSCFDGGMREPTIVCWPAKIPAGTQTTHASQFQDWLATLSDVANAAVPASSSGVSLLPDLTASNSAEASQQLESNIYVDYDVNAALPSYGDFVPAHRDSSDRNQLILYVDGYKGFLRGLKASSVISEQTFEIYDTLNDPQESKNLAGTSPKFIALQDKFRAKALQIRREPDGTSGAGNRAYFVSAKNAVPPIPAGEAQNLVPGTLKYSAFGSEKAFPWVPDFRQLRIGAFAQGTWNVEKSLVPSISITKKNRNFALGVCVEGYITVPSTGFYVFALKTDSNAGTKAFVKLHGVMPLIDADKLYVPGSLATSYMNVGTENPTGTKKVLLAAGTHPIRIEYVAAPGVKNPSVEMEWIIPGAENFAPIPAAAFSSR